MQTWQQYLICLQQLSPGFYIHVPLVDFFFFFFFLVNCMPGKSYYRQLRSLLLCLCDVFQVLINSFVCWFCRGALGLQIMILMNYLLHVVCVWQTWDSQHHHPVECAAHHQHSDHGAPAQDHPTLQGEAACLWLKCVASTSRFRHCRLSLSLVFWLLWSDYCHPFLVFFCIYFLLQWNQLHQVPLFSS